MIEEILKGQKRPKRRGRPKRETPLTREERNARSNEWKKNNNIKNVSLKGHLLDMIHAQQERFSEELGIKLTLQQTIELVFNRLSGEAAKVAVSHQEIIARLVEMSADFGAYPEGAALQNAVDRLARDLKNNEKNLYKSVDIDTER